MPRFFIDTDDGRMAIVDEDGHELMDPRAARDLALRALTDMARSDPTGSDRWAFRAQVRAEDGRTIYDVALTLAGEWLIAQPGA